MRVEIIAWFFNLVLPSFLRCESLCRSNAWRRSFLQSTSPTAFQAWEGDCFQRTSTTEMRTGLFRKRNSLMFLSYVAAFGKICSKSEIKFSSWPRTSAPVVILQVPDQLQIRSGGDFFAQWKEVLLPRCPGHRLQRRV